MNIANVAGGLSLIVFVAVISFTISLTIIDLHKLVFLMPIAVMILPFTALFAIEGMSMEKQE